MKELINTGIKSLLNIPDELKKLRAAFVAEGLDIRFVGGCVRDALANRKCKDIDFCTNATPDQQIAIYKKYDYAYVPTGLQHGTVTVVIDHEGYEITSLRTETDHDGRHATVSYTADWVEDLARRDLTINAMAMTFDGELVDPFNGADDLKNGIVRFVGNPVDRMTEDYLRILRYFRFNGRIGNSFDVTTEEAIRECADGLTKISGERIWAELSKILVGRNATQQMHKMYMLGVAKNIGLTGLPFLKTLANYQDGNAVTALASMLDGHDNAKALNDHWRLSSAEYKMLVWLIEHRSGLFTLHRAQDFIVDGVSVEWVAQLAILHQKRYMVEEIQAWDVPAFPVNGDDLKAKGIKPGPDMGRYIKQMRDAWKDSRFRLTKDQLLNQMNP